MAQPHTAPDLELRAARDQGSRSPSDIDYDYADLLASHRRLTFAAQIDSTTSTRRDLAELEAKISELEYEFDRRQGWARYYLVSGTSGHLHAVTTCSSCSETTSFDLRADLSGLPADEMLAIVGPTACSICFPSSSSTDPTKLSRSWPPHRGMEPRTAAKPRASSQQGFVNLQGNLVADQYGLPFRTEKAAERAAITGLANVVRYDNEERAPHLIRVAAEVEETIALRRGIDVSTVRDEWRTRLALHRADGPLGENCRALGRTVFDAIDLYRARTTVESGGALAGP